MSCGAAARRGVYRGESCATAAHTHGSPLAPPTPPRGVGPAPAAEDGAAARRAAWASQPEGPGHRPVLSRGGSLHADHSPVT